MQRRRPQGLTRAAGGRAHARAGADFEALLIAADGSAGYLTAPQRVPFRDKQAWLNLYRPFDVDGGADPLPPRRPREADGDWAVRLVEGPPEQAEP